MICRNMRLSQDFNGLVEVSIQLTNKLDVKALQEFTDIELLDVIVKKHRKKKTQTQLGALHVLCNEIAKKLNTTKDEIYKHAVRTVGEFQLLPIPENGVNDFINRWCKGSDSAQCVELRDSKLKGYKTLACYFSVATYDTKDMSVLIDYVVDEAAEQGIHLMTREEIKLMKK